MWKINFYMWPSRNYEILSAEDAVEFGDAVDEMNENDNFEIPNEFYGVRDSNNVDAIEYLYGNRQNDISTYIMEIISKQKSTDDTYEMIYTLDEKGYVELAKGDCGEIELSIKNKCDINKVRRHYLKRQSNYDDYIDKLKKCFSDLIFHENALKNIKKLGKFDDVKQELTRHLEVLNDYALKLYYECEQNEEQTLRELKSKYNIICSGKGSNEGKKYKLKYNQYEITCNSHTKLFQSYTDQRIYFCWGRNEIESHCIIIARIGDHWN